MKRKLSVVVILCAVMLMALAGCSKKADGKTEVYFFHRWPNEPSKSYYDKLAAKFEEENPDIKIKMDSVLNDSYKEKIRVLVSSDEIPDVFVSWSDSFAYNLVRSGRVKVLNEMLDKDPSFRDSFIPGQVSPFTFDGKTYGLPQMIDGKAFFYNKEMFAKAGINRLPQTYSEFLNVLDKLKAAGYTTPLLAGFSETWCISHYQGSIFQRLIPMPVLERDFVEEEGVFTHPGYRRGLEILQQLVTYMGPTATSVDHETTRNMFAAEETVPIAQQLPIVYLQLSECGNLQRDNPNMDYGMFNFPAIEGGEGDPTYMTGAPEGFMMSNTSKVPEAAERFYKFLYSQFAMDEYIKIEKSPVGVRGMITPENSYPKLLEVENVIMNVKAFPWFDNAINIQIADVFMRGSQSIAAGEKSYDTVMGEVHTAAASVRAAAGK